MNSWSTTAATKKGIGAALALLLIGALGGCAGAESSPSDSSSSDLKKVTFLSYLPLETLSLAPEMLAVAGGYFAAEGLDVELQPVSGSPVAIQGVLGGVAPITRAGGIDVLTASSTGQALTNVGTLERGGGFRIVSTTDDPIESAEDMVGKTIGIGSEGGTSEKTMLLALAAAGIDPDEVERQVVGLTPATFALVQQGTLDGYMLGIDTAEMVVAANDDAVSSPAGLTAPPDVQAYVTTPAAIESDGEQIKAFLRAIKASVQAIIDDESLDDTLETLRSEYSFAALDDDVVAHASLDAYRKVWQGDGTLDILSQDVDRWDEAYQVLVDAGMADPGGSPQDWITSDLLP